VIESGDIHLADLREERRRRVFVISNARFDAMRGRVLVAAEIERGPDEVLAGTGGDDVTRSSGDPQHHLTD
jgi:hypothetical protein